jgi:hypothetical protein
VKPLRERTTLGRLPGETVTDALARIARAQGLEVPGPAAKPMPAPGIAFGGDDQAGDAGEEA